MKKMFVLLLALSLTFMMVLPASAATSTENNIPSNPNAPVYRPEDFDYQRAYQSDAAKMAQSQALTALQPEHTRYNLLIPWLVSCTATTVFLPLCVRF